jgi:hypothetical protein
MRSRVLLVMTVAAATLTFLASTVGGAAAGASGGTHCNIVKDDTLAPGLSIRGSSGTFATSALGTLECHGPINGKEPTGPGTVSEKGRYGTKDPDTCQDGGEGDGVFSMAIPTSAGDQKFSAAFTFTYGDLSTKGGIVSGKFQGDGISGTFEITPTEGDCVVKPITRIHVTDDFVLSESFFSKS